MRPRVEGGASTSHRAPSPQPSIFHRTSVVVDGDELSLSEENTYTCMNRGLRDADANAVKGAFTALDYACQRYIIHAGHLPNTN